MTTTPYQSNRNDIDEQLYNQEQQREGRGQLQVHEQ